MRKFSKKTYLAAGAAAVVVASGAGVAFAYWTSSGAGSGSGSVGTSTGTLVVTGTAATALTPTNSSTVTFKVANDAAFPQVISNIHLVGVKAYPTADDATAKTNEITTCSAANSFASDGSNNTATSFYMHDVAVASPATSGDGEIAAHATAQSLSETGTLTMNDLSTSQDTCKGAVLVLSFTTT